VAAYDVKPTQHRRQHSYDGGPSERGWRGKRGGGVSGVASLRHANRLTPSPAGNNNGNIALPWRLNSNRQHRATNCRDSWQAAINVNSRQRNGNKRMRAQS